MGSPNLCDRKAANKQLSLTIKGQIDPGGQLVPSASRQFLLAAVGMGRSSMHKKCRLHVMVLSLLTGEEHLCFPGFVSPSPRSSGRMQLLANQSAQLNKEVQQPAEIQNVVRIILRVACQTQGANLGKTTAVFPVQKVSAQLYPTSESVTESILTAWLQLLPHGTRERHVTSVLLHVCKQCACSTAQLATCGNSAPVHRGLWRCLEICRLRIYWDRHIYD